MVNQYPHILKITSSNEAVKDANGNWQTPNNSTTEYKAVCRVEYNTNNRYVVGADGKKIEYNAVLYLPKIDESKVVLGATVDVYKSETKLFSNTIKAISKGQLNARIWL